MSILQQLKFTVDIGFLPLLEPPSLWSYFNSKFPSIFWRSSGGSNSSGDWPASYACRLDPFGFLCIEERGIVYGSVWDDKVGIRRYTEALMLGCICSCLSRHHSTHPLRLSWDSYISLDRRKNLARPGQTALTQCIKSLHTKHWGNCEIPSHDPFDIVRA